MLARAVLTALSVGMLEFDPGFPRFVTTARPVESVVPVVLAYCGRLPTVVEVGADSALQGAPASIRFPFASQFAQSCGVRVPVEDRVRQCPTWWEWWK